MQRRTTGRLIRRTRAAGPGLNSLLVPSPLARRWPLDLLARCVDAAQVEGVMLVAPKFNIARSLAEQTVAGVRTFDPKAADGPIALVVEDTPLVLGPTPGQVRAVDFGPVEAVSNDPPVVQRLQLIDTIMTGRGRAPEAVPALDVLPVSCAIQASRRLSRHALRFLVESGGLAPRTVLRDGERVRGCIWDAALKGAFHLRFSRATTTLWLRWDPAGMQSSSEKVRRRHLRRWIPEDDIDTGDWIVLARLVDHLRGFGWPIEVVQTMIAWCDRLSPLAALAALDGSRSFEPLLSPVGVRVIECVDDWISARWRSALDQSQRGAHDLVAIQRMTHAMTRWIDTLDTFERLDLARALLRTFGEWVAQLDAGAMRDRVNRHPDRQLLRASTAQLIDVGQRLADLRRALGDQRFGDPRYAEAQLFLADYDAHFAPHAGTCAQIGRRLRGVIG